MLDYGDRIEGFAIISEDGMVADANGTMPSALINEADQKFLSDFLTGSIGLIFSSMGAIRMRTSRRLDAASTDCLANDQGDRAK